MRNSVHLGNTSGEDNVDVFIKTENECLKEDSSMAVSLGQDTGACSSGTVCISN